MSAGVIFELSSGLYTKDPLTSKYGRKLLENSVILMQELGFEKFTFKKLASKIDSTEASIYRYFKNKHQLLLYLESWYWEWVSYLIDIHLINLTDPREKLKVAIQNIVNATSESKLNPYINESLLHKLIINDGAKAYHTTLVDKENQSGLFHSYKALIHKVSVIILEVNPDYEYPHSIATNIFEMSNNQIYFAEHLPQLTDIKFEQNCNQELIKLLTQMTFKILS